MPASSHRVAIVAGEESGDVRGAALMQALHDRAPDIHFLGAGGHRMAALAGPPFENWVEKAGVVGIWDVLCRYTWFRAKFRDLHREIVAARPGLVIFVDYPGFNLRMARALRKSLPQARLVYHISPQVWAWNRRRISQMARDLDLVLCLFPFEKPLYEASGLRAEFVGHPLVGELAAGAPFPGREENLVGLFPGSREREVRKLFPVMVEAVRLVRRARPETRFTAAAAGARHVEWMREILANHGGEEIAVEISTAHSLMARATFGWVCSGTATLEAALFGLPHCLVYKVPWLTYEIGRRVIRVPFLGMANILAGREVVREFIQDDCSPFALADEALAALNNPPARHALSARLREAVSQLGGPGASERAADCILKLFAVS